MLKTNIYLAILFLLICSAASFKSRRTFKFINNCNQKIWIGAFGVPLPSVTGWEMESQSSYNLNVDSNSVAMRFWARTGCQFKDGKFVCATGDCGAPLNNFGI